MSRRDQNFCTITLEKPMANDDPQPFELRDQAEKVFPRGDGWKVRVRYPKVREGRTRVKWSEIVISKSTADSTHEDDTQLTAAAEAAFPDYDCTITYGEWDDKK